MKKLVGKLESYIRFSTVKTPWLIKKSFINLDHIPGKKLLKDNTNHNTLLDISGIPSTTTFD